MKYSIITTKNEEESSKIKNIVDFFNSTYNAKTKCEITKTVIESGTVCHKVILEGNPKYINLVLDYLNDTMSDNKKFSTEKKNSITLLPNNVIKVSETKETEYVNYELDDVLMRHDLQ